MLTWTCWLMLIGPHLLSAHKHAEDYQCQTTMLHCCLWQCLTSPAGLPQPMNPCAVLCLVCCNKFFCQWQLTQSTQTTLSKLRSRAKFKKLQVNGVHVMQGVTYTKRDAQEAMQKLLQGNVVLVGHALHHDLHALHLDPIAVIDTALLCSYKYANLVQRCVQCVMLRPCSSALPALPVIPFSCLSTCATTQQTHPVQNRYCQAAILHTNCSI